jgi:hypothetical protein
MWINSNVQYLLKQMFNIQINTKYIHFVQEGSSRVLFQMVQWFPRIIQSSFRFGEFRFVWFRFVSVYFVSRFISHFTGTPYSYYFAYIPPTISSQNRLSTKAEVDFGFSQTPTWLLMASPVFPRDLSNMVPLWQRIDICSPVVFIPTMWLKKTFHSVFSFFFFFF